jgi:hypothetical protein
MTNNEYIINEKYYLKFNINMEYPFPEDKIPQISRITSAMVGGQDFLFPDVISYGVVYHHGLTRDE